MNIEKFFMTNKYILLSILVVVLFFYFVSPTFLPSFPFVEGFTADQYKYLAPVPANNTWSQDTMTKFAEKWNGVNNTTAEATAESLSQIMINATEEEAKYYIKNGNWPYDAYIMNYMKQNPNLISNMKQDDGSPQTLSNLAKHLSNRTLYSQLIAPFESTQSPQPPSYQIFMGTIPDPDASTSTSTSQTDISPITSSSLSSASTLSESNYNTLVSLCKNIIPV